MFSQMEYYGMKFVLRDAESFNLALRKALSITFSEYLELFNHFLN